MSLDRQQGCNVTGLASGLGMSLERQQGWQCHWRGSRAVLEGGAGGSWCLLLGAAAKQESLQHMSLICHASEQISHPTEPAVSSPPTGKPAVGLMRFVMRKRRRFQCVVLYSQEDWSALPQFFVSYGVPCTVCPKSKSLYFGIA